MTASLFTPIKFGGDGRGYTDYPTLPAQAA